MVKIIGDVRLQSWNEMKAKNPSCRKFRERKRENKFGWSEEEWITLLRISATTKLTYPSPIFLLKFLLITHLKCFEHFKLHFFLSTIQSNYLTQSTPLSWSVPAELCLCTPWRQKEFQNELLVTWTCCLSAPLWRHLPTPYVASPCHFTNTFLVSTKYKQYPLSLILASSSTKVPKKRNLPKTSAYPRAFPRPPYTIN